MTTQVWKTAVPLIDEQEIEVPVGAEFLHVGVQAEPEYAGAARVSIWYRCGSPPLMEKRRVRIAGTGHALSDEPWVHIGSFFLQGGALVFHVFVI